MSQMPAGPEVTAEQLWAASPVPQLLLDGAGRVQRVNPALAALLGVPEERLLGAAYPDLLHPDGPAALTADDLGSEREQRFDAAGGRTVWGLVTAAAVTGGGRLLGVVDVSARKLTEEQLVYAALHDGLTDLPNRRLLNDRLATALARAERASSSVAVIFLDLDSFKAVNDAHGHAVGDAVLSAVARNLASTLRSCDTVARIGGDEFVVLCEDLDSEGDVPSLAERVRQALSVPIAVPGGETTVAASLGVAVPNRWATTPEAMIRLADAAMYRAKRRPDLPYVLADVALAAEVIATAERPEPSAS
jgi:diguanylate cyclase (GGDEF)-like protein/PAS domain S-box-containing protein